MRDCKKFCWRKGSYTPVKPNPAPVNTHNYSLDYLTTEALEDGTISFNIYSTMGTEYITSISYSTDNGNSWTTVNNVDNKEENLVIPVSVSQGDKILWKGDAQQTGYLDGFSFFSSDCEFNVYGNIMSLLYENEFSDKIELEYDYQFWYLFNDWNEVELCKVVDASNLILPATTLTNGCYRKMFYNCTSLTTAPALPATTLAESCYSGMFMGCTSLVNTPELLATTLAEGCYEDMFRGCTALITAPELPATTLADYCYYYMFCGCTSLTQAPELPATTLTNNCYQSMFYGCTSLTTAPELSATTLEEYCYNAMFKDCTSLITAPELPATTLAEYCYSNMFDTCTSLSYIKCLATDISASNCTSSWVAFVSNSGTFVKDVSMASWTTGDNGIPSGWTVQDA